MRRLTFFVALAIAIAVSTSEAAKPTSNRPTAGKPTTTKVQTPKSGTTRPGTVKVSGSKGSTAKVASPSGSKSLKPAKTTPKQVAGGSPKASGKSLKSAKSDTRTSTVDKTAKGAKGKNTYTNSGTSTSKTSPTIIDFTSTSVGQKLEKNSALRSKIEAKLQAAGYTGTAYEAGYGFKNVGQLNAATNQVQNHGTSFGLLKVLMTGTYVDPVTHNVYRTQQLPDGTTQLVKPARATNSPSTVSLGQAKQAITGGAEMPKIVVYTATSPTSSKTTSSSTATAGTLTSTSGKSKPRKSSATTPATQPGGNF